MFRSPVVTVAIVALVASAPTDVPTTSDAPPAVPPPSLDDPAVDDPAVTASVVDGPRHGPTVVPAADERPDVSLRPRVDVVDGDPTEMARLDEALALFRANGLPLPDVQIAFHDDRSACNGHDGLFQRQAVPWRLRICSDVDYVVTHELAHAWLAANLDDAERESYRVHRGYSTWRSTDVPWRDRAVEDAAFMIQQNLMAGSVDVASERWLERTAAYELLTGRRSPLLSADGRPPTVG